MQFYVAIVIFLVLLIASAVRILKEYERGVIFRLGRIIDSKGPGIIFLIPLIDKMVKVSLRTIVMDVPPQDVITKDNVSIQINAVLYFRVVNPTKSVIEVENFLFATSQLAQTTLRSIAGQAELDELLMDRDRINQELQKIIDTHSDPWGIKVSLVEIKHIDLPEEMKRAMAKQAEAERERRAKVIAAEGEFQAAGKLTDAAKKIDESPSALQLRFLQTLVEVGAEKNTTTIFPLPLELFAPFMDKIRNIANK
ncbi:MAG: slipin family protein [Calditrichaeota bacterium]|nr:MAG: slipin family protein [Calditrichota bacterium]MBL1205995.1 slipin family protein [Calditrichota bacterium]NOG45823.1 slipin family protein [Calditrichota bacterium]